MRPAHRDDPLISCDNRKLEILLSLIVELKNKLLAIEVRYPSLGHDFTSLCDEFVEHLNSITSLPIASVETCNKNDIHTEYSKEQRIDDDLTDIPARDIAHPPRQANPMSRFFDAVGDYIITGLDKMGDGVILIFESVLKIAKR